MAKEGLCKGKGEGDSDGGKGSSTSVIVAVPLLDAIFSPLPVTLSHGNFRRVRSIHRNLLNHVKSRSQKLRYSPRNQFCVKYFAVGRAFPKPAKTDPSLETSQTFNWKFPRRNCLLKDVDFPSGCILLSFFVLLKSVKKSKCICTDSLAKILSKKGFNISETPL